MTNDNCLITVSLNNWHGNNCDKTLSEGHRVNIHSCFFLLSEDHKWTVLYYFADFELYAIRYTLRTTYHCFSYTLRSVLVPNGIKLFQTDSLLNTGIHRYTCLQKTFRGRVLASGYFPWTGTMVYYYMASSASWQDEPNRALWLATRAGKMEPSLPLGTTRCIPQAKFPLKPYNKYFIDQVCSVKMAGYWPPSFFASLWTSTSSRPINTQKKNLANIQPSWPHTWSITHT